jgi:hypothetical protein
MDGKTFYVNGLMHSGTHSCYKVTVGQSIYQSSSVESSMTNKQCEEHWKSAHHLGNYAGDVDGQEHFDKGDSDGCEGPRVSTLVVVGDPTATGESISVSEPGLCNYEITLTVPPFTTFKSEWKPDPPGSCKSSQLQNLGSPLDSGERAARRQFSPSRRHALRNAPRSPSVAQTDLDEIFNSGKCTPANNCYGITYCPGTDPPDAAIDVYFSDDTSLRHNAHCFTYTFWDEDSETEMENTEVLV